LSVTRTPKKTNSEVSKILKEMTVKVKDADCSVGSDVLHTDFWPSGNSAIDYVIGGGLPMGKIVEVFGPESSGKTTLLMCWIAEIQSRGGICALVDIERALSPNYAMKLGVDLSNLLLSEPDNGESAFEAIRFLVRTNKVKLIGVDSVAGLVPKYELDGKVGDKHIALQARLVGQGLRMLVADIKKAGCCVVFLNQLRDKIGVMFGSPTDTPGGRALKFWASVRLDIRRRKILEDKLKKVLGNTSEVINKKNKVGYPFKKATVDIFYSSGISQYSGLLELAERLEVVQKVKGRTYSFNGEEFTKGSFETEVAGNPEFIKRVFFDG